MRLPTADGYAAPAASIAAIANPQFTVAGIIILGVVIWAAAQSATGEARQILNLFLVVLLTSMVLLNWDKISPLIFKSKG